MKTIFRPSFWDNERESRWLNKMSNEGWALVRYYLCFYIFEKCEQGEYVFQVELLEHLPNSLQGKKYIEFLTDSSLECVATFFRWAIFRWKANDNPFKIYTDYDSRIKHCKRTAQLTGVFAANMIFWAIFHFSSWLNLSVSYDYLHLIAATMNLLVCGIMTSVAVKNLKRIKRLKREQEIYDATDSEEE